MREVTIRGEMVRLGQLLKLAGVADNGGHAKALLAAGAVRVNGEPEERRGRQLHPGDVVEAEGEMLRLAGRPEAMTASAPPLCPSCGQPASEALAGPEHGWECRNEACPEFGQPIRGDEAPAAEPGPGA